MHMGLSNHEGFQNQKHVFKPWVATTFFYQLFCVLVCV